jgi:uncharacterized membrane protein
MNQPFRRNKHKVKYQKVQHQAPTQEAVDSLHLETRHEDTVFPSPAILAEFDQLVPGSAEKIIESYIEEGHHRRRIENNITKANIHAKGQQVEQHKRQVNAINDSDFRGHVMGFLVCALSILGAIYAGIKNLHALSLMLALFPTAVLVKEFFIKHE